MPQQHASERGTQLDQEFFDVKSVAAMVDLSPDTVYDHIAAGRLAATRFGRNLRIHRDTVAEIKAKGIPQGRGCAMTSIDKITAGVNDARSERARSEALPAEFLATVADQETELEAAVKAPIARGQKNLKRLAEVESRPRPGNMKADEIRAAKHAERVEIVPRIERELRDAIAGRDKLVANFEAYWTRDGFLARAAADRDAARDAQIKGTRDC